MPTNDSIEQVTPSIEGLPPIYACNGVLKVVYSNRPDLVRQRPWGLFRAGEEPMWFPENTIVGDTLEQSLASMVEKDFLIVTNSLYLLRAFHMARHRLNKVVRFLYVHFDPEPHSIHVCPFNIRSASDLELLPIPQLDWEISQSAAYLDTLLT